MGVRGGSWSRSAGLFMAHAGGGVYGLGLALFVVGVVFVFWFIKRYFDRLDAGGIDMSASGWDPGQYLRFADERLRPALDLLGAVPLNSARRVVDLGCGAGNVTAILKRRFPAAEVIGIDGSARCWRKRARRYRIAASFRPIWRRGSRMRRRPDLFQRGAALDR